MCTVQHTGHSHLSQDDRVVIEALRAQGATLRTIAECIHKHYSTVSRELTRNGNTQGVYTAHDAQKKSATRRLHSRHGTRKIEHDAELARAIETKLRGAHPLGDWSPAIIAQGVCKIFCVNGLSTVL